MSRLASRVAIIFAGMLIFWGVMNSIMPDAPYGDIARPVGIVQILLGFYLLYERHKHMGRMF